MCTKTSDKMLFLFSRHVTKPCNSHLNWVHNGCFASNKHAQCRLALHSIEQNNANCAKVHQCLLEIQLAHVLFWVLYFACLAHAPSKTMFKPNGPLNKFSFDAPMKFEQCAFMRSAAQTAILPYHVVHIRAHLN